ncbi:hypothetical protein BKA93DRAFT_734013, partial [Sparassis latifolia]
LVYNRSARKSQSLQKPFRAENVQIAHSPEQPVLDCDIVCTSLTNDAVVQSVFSQFITVLELEKEIFVKMSTVYPSVSGEIEAPITHIPLTNFATCHIFGPIFGPPPAADSATLVCALAGEHGFKKEMAHST